MKNLLQTTNHPFRFLLYVEWILLSISILTEIPWYEVFPYLIPLMENPSSHLITNPWLWKLICILIFGLMGLRLPTRKAYHKKWLYILLQFGLVLLADNLDGWSSFSTPYLIILIRSCLIFPSREKFFVAGLSFLCSMLSMFFSIDIQGMREEYTHAVKLTSQQIKALLVYETFHNTFYYGLVLIFVLMLVNALINESQSRQHLAIAHDQLRQYTLRIEDQATLEERNRIAREIHDSLGHALTAQSIQLESALLFCHSDANKTQKYLEVSRKLAGEALAEIRKSVSALRTEPLQGKSLPESITQLTQNFCKITNIQANFFTNFEYPLSIDINIAIYRIIQEALTNISKHSQATKVDITLKMQVGNINLQIKDNGKGFNPEQNTTGFGLQGMRERTVSLGGKLSVISTLGRGCRIIVDIPLAKLPFNEPENSITSGR